MTKVLNEMALARKDALNRCLDLSIEFIRHFDKLYKDPNSIDADHWAKEMQNWLNQVNSIVLKENNKQLSLDKKIDWFLTGGSDAETLFDGDEADKYNEFIEEIIKDWNVVEALKRIGDK